MAFVARRALGLGQRSFSAAAATAAPSVDWAMLRSKMQTAEGQADADKAKDLFQRRLAAARSVTEPSDLDWAAYKAKLPELDVDAIKADYEKVLKSIPAIPYDASADKAAHETKEKAWEGFSKYCTEKVAELKLLAAEQADHKLHRWYRRSRIWQRFPGLYEELHNKARGTWDRELWGNYIAYKARATPLPWDPTFGDIDDAKRRELYSEISGKTGLSLEALGYSEKK